MTDHNSRFVISLVGSGRKLGAEYDRDVPAADNETSPSRWWGSVVDCRTRH
jgi:hypothetical protein